MRELIFRDREDAGRRLAAVLSTGSYENPVILGLPRGGVVVAAEIARALGAPLDVIVARKIGAPFEPELAIGAVAPGGVVVMDDRFQVGEELVRQLAETARREMQDRIRRFRRDNEEMPELRDRTAIIVDDGLATGMTAIAAVRAAKRRSPRRTVLAVPVGSSGGLELLREEADEVVAVSVPEDFFAIGQWYADFDPVSDDEVVDILESFAPDTHELRARRPGHESRVS